MEAPLGAFYFFKTKGNFVPVHKHNYIVSNPCTREGSREPNPTNDATLIGASPWDYQYMKAPLGAFYFFKTKGNFVPVHKHNFMVSTVIKINKKTWYLLYHVIDLVAAEEYLLICFLLLLLISLSHCLYCLLSVRFFQTAETAEPTVLIPRITY